MDSSLESSPSVLRPSRRAWLLRPAPAIPSSIPPGRLLRWQLWRAPCSPRCPALRRSVPLHRVRRRKRQHRRTVRAQPPPVKPTKVEATLGSSGAGVEVRHTSAPSPAKTSPSGSGVHHPISRPGSLARKRPAPASWRRRSGQSSARFRSSRQRRRRTLSAAPWRSSRVTHRLSSTL